MRKIKILYVNVVGAIFLLATCTEKDIEVTPTTEIADAYYRMPENIPTILATTYNFLWVRTGPWGNSHRAWGNFPSDDAYTGGADDGDQQTYQDADKYQVTPLDPASNLMTQWRVNFQGIYACNLLIDNVPATTDANLQAIAEAKFLKALYYFELARMFGGLPLLTKVASPTEQFSRSTYEETLEYIAQLLREAIATKKLDGSTPAMQQRSGLSGPDNGRATLASAQALLGKVYLYQKKYAEAIEILLKVDQNPNYELEANYSDIFEATNKFGKESLFEVCYAKANAVEGSAMGNGEIQLFGPRPTTLSQFNADILAGWGFDQPSQSLVDAYKSQNDYVRLNKTVISSDSLQAIYTTYSGDATPIVWQNAKDGYWDGKHLPRKSNRGAAWGNDYTNTIILRLADVYLMLAEAYNQTGNDAKAQEYLNRVRTRVGLPNVTATGSALYEAIKLERRLELALEGERYFDLLRWGDAETYLGPLGWIDGTPGKKTNGLFPIPQAEINRTDGPSKLVQNPGY
ncbi:MAG: RagB/SusD family nutrient uptake outer membrane protein [Bacteroidales bacterium]|nr:RagB/SusD family nutrient uptake outer membrane protein [Bacteroidales bacterium]